MGFTVFHCEEQRRVVVHSLEPLFFHAINLNHDAILDDNPHFAEPDSLDAVRIGSRSIAKPFGGPVGEPLVLRVDLHG